ncbi:MAG TPA: hypothetical protein VEK07_24100 [Polyangiaceae bacterium]|nr:hypothetical protein [Polyangiaceae bacterium]
MKQHPHRLVLALIGCLVGCSGAAASSPAAMPIPAARADPATLDGRSFDVTLEIPDSTPVKDTLRFDHGNFESTACTALGFPQWSPYVVQADSDQLAFHALAKHPSGTTMDWKGGIKGSAVEGTANRNMSGKTDLIRFRGSLQP